VTERLRELERQASQGDSNAAQLLDAELWRRGVAIANAPELRKECWACEQSQYLSVTCCGTVPVPEDERLKWLSYCGHEDARAAVGDTTGLIIIGFSDWLRGLPAYLQIACALGAARLVLPRWLDTQGIHYSMPGAEYPLRWVSNGRQVGKSLAYRRAIAAIEALAACAAWLRDPTLEGRKAWSYASNDYAISRILNSRDQDVWVPWPNHQGSESACDLRIEACASLHGDIDSTRKAAKKQAIQLLLRGEEML